MFLAARIASSIFFGSSIISCQVHNGIVTSLTQQTGPYLGKQPGFKALNIHMPHLLAYSAFQKIDF